MKALVLSGGSGTRFRPLSHSMPKQLLPVANRPVLELVLETVSGLGVTEIGVVVGRWGPDIRTALGDGRRFGVPITYLHQDQPRGLADCVRLARSFLGDDDFVMYLGDNVLPDGVADIAADFRVHRPAAQIVVHKVSDPQEFGVAELDPHGTVLRVVEKPARPRSDLAMIGVYFFTAAVHEAVAAIDASTRGELEITDAVQWLLASGADVRASVYDGYWKDTGQVDDLLDCNRRMLADLTPAIAGDVDPASTLTGQVVVEPGARVVRSRIDGPAVIGAGTLVEDSTVGPFTAIGPDCVLRRCNVADSVVLAGATISAVPPLARSLIGRAATVSAGDGLAHRLVIGDDTRIELAA